MSLMMWREEPIGKCHDRAAFDRDDEELNIFLQRFAKQSHDKGGAKTFVAVSDLQPERILGF